MLSHVIRKNTVVYGEIRSVYGICIRRPGKECGCRGVVDLKKYLIISEDLKCHFQILSIRPDDSDGKTGLNNAD